MTGTIGVRAAPRRLTAVARDPRAVLSAVWGGALQRAGIALEPGSPTSARRRRADRRSWPRSPRRRSTRWPARSTAAASIWAPSCCCSGPAAGSTRPALLTDHVRQVVGLGSDGVYLVDGSGLSYDDRVTPRAFVTYLARFPTTPAGPEFPACCCRPTAPGTLHRLNSGFPGVGVVRAKTGTLGRVSTVVGYLGRPEGTLLVALMYNGGRPWAARQAQWKLFRELGANGVVIPTDTRARVPPVQLGGDPTSPPPSWWPAGAAARATRIAARIAEAMDSTPQAH